MESEFLLNLKEISTEVIVISILVFSLTMLIKWPIKRATANLAENKRKAVNTIIVFIPMFLSFVMSLVYYGVFQKIWLDTVVYDTMASSYVVAVTIYAIYSRIVILIKGLKKDNKTTDVSADADFSKETVSFVKQNVKTISQALKVDQTNLESTITKIEKLLSIRNEITSNTLFQDIALAEKLDNQISGLEEQKEELTKSISEKQSEIDNYQKSINK